MLLVVKVATEVVNEVLLAVGSIMIIVSVSEAV